MIKCNSSVHTIDVNKVSKNFYPFFHPIHMWNLKCTDKRHSYTSNCSYLIFHLIYIRIYYNCVNNNIIIAIYLLRVVCSLPTPYNTHTHTRTQAPALILSFVSSMLLSFQHLNVSTCMMYVVVCLGSHCMKMTYDLCKCDSKQEWASTKMVVENVHRWSDVEM